MPLFYNKDPGELPPEVEPPELDLEKLEEIQNQCDYLAELIKAELIRIKRNKQTQRIDGGELYHRLNEIIRKIKPAGDCIDRIRAKG